MRYRKIEFIPAEYNKNIRVLRQDTFVGILLHSEERQKKKKPAYCIHENLASRMLLEFPKNDVYTTLEKAKKRVIAAHEYNESTRANMYFPFCESGEGKIKIMHRKLEVGKILPGSLYADRSFYYFANYVLDKDASDYLQVPHFKECSDSIHVQTLRDAICVRANQNPMTPIDRKPIIAEAKKRQWKLHGGRFSAKRAHAGLTIILEKIFEEESLRRGKMFRNP